MNETRLLKIFAINNSVENSILVECPTDYMCDYSYRAVKKIQYITGDTSICGECVYDSHWDSPIVDRKIWKYNELMAVTKHMTVDEMK